MSEQAPRDGGTDAAVPRPWDAPAGSTPQDVPAGPGQHGGWGPPATGAYQPGRPAQPDPGWRPPPKPGVVPLRPLGLGELLDGSVQTMRQNPRVMIGLSAAVMAVAGVVSTVFMVAGLPRLFTALDTPQEQLGAADVANGIGGALSGFLVPTLVQAVAVTVLSGILILAVSEAVLGRRPGAAQVWARARARVPALLGLTLLTALITLVGVGLLLAPGLALLAASGTAAAVALVLGALAGVVLTVFLWVRLAFAAPALLLEDLGVRAALRRSWRLVRGSWWRVLGVLLVTAIISAVANGLLQTPFSIIGAVVATVVAGDGAETASGVSGSLVLTTVIGNVGGVIASTVSAPFSAAVTALLYIDLRIRREGLDVALARASEA